MCKGPSPYSPIGDRDGCALYTQEPEFLMSSSGPAFQLIPMKFFKGQETLNNETWCDTAIQRVTNMFTETRV